VRWKLIASRGRPRFREAHAIRLIRQIRWMRGFMDSAAPFGQSITTASRNATNRELDSAHGVVARTGLAAFPTDRLAAALGEDLDRASRDDVCRSGVHRTKA
jgi:hypothetical protein